MEHSGRRDSAKIAAEMIRAASHDVSKTGMMYAARLNYKQLKRHLADLVRKGLVLPDQGTGTYSSTVKGRAFLNAYDEVETLADALQEKQKAMMAFFQIEVEEKGMGSPSGGDFAHEYATQPLLEVKRLRTA